MVCGFDIPTQGLRADGGECKISGPPIRQGWSFAAWVARQPVKLGGMGLRSFAEHLSSIAHVMSHFQREVGGQLRNLPF